MIRRIDLTAGRHEVFAEPTPLGLIGLAIGCASLMPLAIGASLTPAALKTAAMICLLFGGGCQLFAGVMSLVNKNLLGGTLFTAFAFNWGMNWWMLDASASGTVPDSAVLFAVDLAFLVVFSVLTIGFGYFSKLLFVFLLDIDLLEVAKLLKHFGAPGSAFFSTCNIAIAALTAGLGLIALYIAFALLMNPTVGRPLFRIGGPLFAAAPKPRFDPSIRQQIFEVLYAHWREKAFELLTFDEIRGRMRTSMKGPASDGSIVPDLCYLDEIGAIALGESGDAARLTAAGIDLHEQLALKKYETGGVTP